MARQGWDTAAALLALALAGCGDDSGTGNAAGQGGGGGEGGGGTIAPAAYYEGPESAALGAAGNEARCSTCHSDDGAEGYSGNTFMDLAFHDSFKGGEADLLGAVNACVTGWMGGAALTSDDEAFIALRTFMEGISDPGATTSNPIAPEVLADEAAYGAAYDGGDAVAGEAKYATYCARCHGGGLVVGPMAAPDTATLGALSIGRIAQQVRTSGPPPSGMNDATDSTPGPMPFFEPSELPASDLADIVAFLTGG